MMLRKIYYSLNSDLRLLFRRLWFLPADVWESFSKDKNPLIPPKGLIFTGRGDYVNQGEAFFKIFRRYCQLEPTHTILDIGSGVGRMAISLIGFLSPTGEYYGLDIVKSGIKWCTKSITKRFPNFKFIHADIYNDLYNDKGKLNATNYRFPFDDKKFDFIFLTSVFTHMLPDEVENYLKEISRVLKPESKCLITFFILNDYSVRCMRQNITDFQFPFEKGYYSLMSEDAKTGNVAFKEDYLESLFERFSLKIVHKSYGFWTGRNKAECLDFQDIIIIEKLI